MTGDNDQGPLYLYINMPGGPIRVEILCSGSSRSSRRIKIYECLNCGFKTEDPEWDDDGEDDFPVCPKCRHLMKFWGVRK